MLKYTMLNKKEIYILIYCVKIFYNLIFIIYFNIYNLDKFK